MGFVNWVVLGCILVSSFFVLIALSRMGIRFFWSPVGRSAPVLRVVEYAPIALLILLCIGLTVYGESVMRFTRATVSALYQPQGYIDAVLSARPLPTATNAARLGLPHPELAP